MIGVGVNIASLSVADPNPDHSPVAMAALNPANCWVSEVSGSRIMLLIVYIRVFIDLSAKLAGLWCTIHINNIANIK